MDTDATLATRAGEEEREEAREELVEEPPPSEGKEVLGRMPPPPMMSLPARECVVTEMLSSACSEGLLGGKWLPSVVLRRCRRRAWRSARQERRRLRRRSAVVARPEKPARYQDQPTRITRVFTSG